ncbi:MAG: hypothetical protein M0Z28_17015 [Rhodospirillales bacterium]|nr:hypothetical protein [Rhodospirillales bacterium]
MSEQTTLQPGGTGVSGDQEAKDRWVRAVLGTEVRRPRSGAVIGTRGKSLRDDEKKSSGNKDQQLPLESETEEEEQKPENQDDSAYAMLLGQHYEGLVSLRDHESEAPKVNKAREELTTSLEAMSKAEEEKNYAKALEHLNAAIEAGKTMRLEIEEADKPRTEFMSRYNGIVGRRQRAIDLIPSTARLLEAKEKFTAEDEKLQRLLDGPDFTEAGRALDAMIEKLNHLETEIVDTGIARAKSLDDVKDGLKEVRKSALEAINAVSDTETKKKLTERWNEFDGAVRNLDTLTEVEELGWQAGKLEPKGVALLKDALAAANSDSDKRQTVFKSLLQERFDLTITIPDGMSNTHLEKVYDMFSQVPPEHVGHDKLKKLVYDKNMGGGSYNRVEARIKMGSFSENKEEAYTVDGKKVQVNSFNVTTLHEIGHSVDNKFNVMGANRGKSGCGGWETHTTAEVARIFLDGFKSNPGLPDGVDENVVLRLVTRVLTEEKITWPAKTANEVKDALRPLLNRCISVTAGKQPWWNGPVAVGPRAYSESSKGVWYSYLTASRASTYTNSYQWRAPGEWFAELYAVTWLKKQEPPGAVDKAAANYMWGGAFVGTR